MNEDNLHQAGVSGNHTTNGIPHGSTSLTPFLAVTGATDAVEFYRSVFGARLVDATEINGIVVHAELDFGNGKLQLGEPALITASCQPRRARASAIRWACTVRMSTPP